MWSQVDERWLPDRWRDVPAVPRNQQRRFAARALTASGDVAVSGEIFAGAESSLAFLRS